MVSNLFTLLIRKNPCNIDVRVSCKCDLILRSAFMSSWPTNYGFIHLHWIYRLLPAHNYLSLSHGLVSLITVVRGYLGFFFITDIQFLFLEQFHVNEAYHEVWWLASCFFPWISQVLLVLVSIIWLRHWCFSKTCQILKLGCTAGEAAFSCFRYLYQLLLSSQFTLTITLKYRYFF